MWGSAQGCQPHSEQTPVLKELKSNKIDGKSTYKLKRGPEPLNILVVHK